MITKPYPIVNGLKTMPFSAAHTRIANIWEYPPPHPRGRTYGEVNNLLHSVCLVVLHLYISVFIKLNGFSYCWISYREEIERVCYLPDKVWVTEAHIAPWNDVYSLGNNSYKDCMSFEITKSGFCKSRPSPSRSEIRQYVCGWFQIEN